MLVMEKGSVDDKKTTLLGGGGGILGEEFIVRDSLNGQIVSTLFGAYCSISTTPRVISIISKFLS